MDGGTAVMSFFVFLRTAAAVSNVILFCFSFNATYTLIGKEMHKYFVDAELNSMLGSTYDCTDYSEVSKSLALEFCERTYRTILV